ncbi:MAG: tetratricopeptide repeat protein, partial [Alphaproteobacteria bacterium]
VPQDYAEAMKWYRKAADQGDAPAQNNLGFMYDSGWGVPQDYAEAAKWYRKAADQGIAIAQLNLGVSYELGDGGPRDYVEAHKWFNLAASRFPPGELRDKTEERRDGLAEIMTPDQITEAHRLAREWKPKKGPPVSEDTSQ